MSEREKETALPQVEVRVDAAKVSNFEIGTRWKVVASSPGSLWEGVYTVTFERIETTSDEG